MRKLILTTTAMVILAGAAIAGPSIGDQLDTLSDRIEVVNDEDQRLTDGDYDQQTGVLTLYTEDMDGDSRRAVVVEGITAGADGIDGADGINADSAAIFSRLAANNALGSLQTRQAMEGQWTGAFGFSGSEDGAEGMSVGVRYGITSYSDMYLMVGGSTEGDISWATGLSFDF